MNSTHGLTAENLLRALPTVLQNDPSMAALAASIAEKLAARPGEIRGLMIYTRIDELPEALLDVLAVDFKVDWWDPDYSLEEKRKTLKDSWRVHRMLGTKAAVETAISAIYPDTRVVEWFQYGGSPFHFKLRIDATYEDVDPQKHKRVLERVDYYKNLRSHMEGVEYIVHPEAKAVAYADAVAGGIHMILSARMETADRLAPRATATAGIGIGVTCIRAQVEASVKVYGGSAELRMRQN